MDLSELPRITIVKANGGWIVQGSVFVPPEDVGEDPEEDGEYELAETSVFTDKMDVLRHCRRLMNGMLRLPREDHESIDQALKKGDDDTPVPR